jgi:hypothetical protein
MAHFPFPAARAVHLGGVEEPDAPIDGRPDQGDRLLLVHRRAVPEAHAHAAEPDGRLFQASLIVDRTDPCWLQFNWRLQYG